MMNYETQCNFIPGSAQPMRAPTINFQREEIPMKSATTFVSSPFKVGHYSAVLAVLCALMAMTDPAAPEAVKWIGIPLIALTVWLAFRQIASDARLQSHS